MRFIGQIELYPSLFGAISGRMAYIFMTDEDEYVDSTWEPDGGENAVIIQPGQNPVISSQQREGPAVYRMVKKPFRRELVPEPCQFQVQLVDGEDPDLLSSEKLVALTDDQAREYEDTIKGNKVGGSPWFIQAHEYPGPGAWNLLLQLDSTDVPFYVNFGDAGVGYAFVSTDGKTGKFLWQCC